MQSIAPTIWSAVAASFAALSAVLMVFIQHRNLVESARPELVLAGWSRKVGQGEGAHDVIAFQTIRNVGRGPALHLSLNAHHMTDNRSTAVMASRRRKF